MDVQYVIDHYPELKYKIPLNRIFYDYGQDTVLEATITSLKDQEDIIMSALEFLHDSFLSYQKRDWGEKIESSQVLTLLQELVNRSPHLIGCKAAENLGWWNANWGDQDDQGMYDFFKEAFAHHFEKGQDPILLYQLFAELNRKDGGVWVNDYQVDMIWQLLDHNSRLMKIAGLGCFRELRPDEDEVEPELWDRINELKGELEYDFVHLKITFQKFLQEQNKFDYSPYDLEEYLKHHYQAPE